MKRRRWSTTVRLRIRERYGCICQMCRMPLDERGFDLDHHIPLALGGEDVEDNLRPLCRRCHRIKTETVDVPGYRKAVRREARHVGAKAPSATPLPFGRRSPLKRKLNGQIVARTR